MSTATATRTSGAKDDQGAASVKLLGLCASCDHAGNCMHLSRNEGGVWRCEDFEAGEPARTIGLRKAGAPPENPPLTNLVGLCANCEERNDCAQARRTGGVWHCEQFV